MSDHNPVTLLLTVLAQHLHEASATATAACEAARAGNQNLAIGTLLPAERLCTEAQALLSVVLSLHAHMRDVPKDSV
ncbi:MAG: hypothetical protein EBS23_00850 [Betaproteobacteria bacterium]|nr:hypothetical protein [Betaproteobacteria bacterium]